MATEMVLIEDIPRSYLDISLLYTFIPRSFTAVEPFVYCSTNIHLLSLIIYRRNDYALR